MIRLIRSLWKSVWNAIASDPEVRKFVARYPRFFHFLKNRLTPNEKFGLSLTIGSFIAVFFVFLFFGLVEDLMGQAPLIQSDLRIINLVQIFRTPLFNTIMLFITYLGSWQVVAVGVALGGIIVALYRRWYYLVALVVSVGFGELFIVFLKIIIHRPRPPLVHALAPEKSFSFPSGHSFVALSFYGLIVYFLLRSLKKPVFKVVVFLVGLIITLAIGFSRIYLGVHWPSDVLASYASAAAWITALITALEIRRKFHNGSGARSILSPRTHIVVTIIALLVWMSYVVFFFWSHPLHAPEEEKENQIHINVENIPDQLFDSFPRTSEDITGKPMEPINVIIVGTYKELETSFEKAGWFPTNPINPKTFGHIFVTSLLNKPYPQAPGTPSFWNMRPNEFSFEQPTDSNTVRERHHVHFWATPFVTEAGQQVWFGTAHFDKTIRFKAGGFLPTHIIDPAVDTQREKIKKDLQETNQVEKSQEFSITEPLLGSNQSGDYFFTDGKAVIFFLRRE